MKIYLPTAITVSALLTISGCTSTPEPSPEMQKITNQQVEIESLKTNQQTLQTQLDSLQTVQPDVERLVAMEDELNELIQQQKSLIKENKMKELEAKRKQHENRPFYMLQLASFKSLETIKSTWEAQQISHPEILNGLPARYQQVDVAGQQYYRLKVGEFDQKLEALEVCKQLIAHQTDCLVVNNKGSKL